MTAGPVLAGTAICTLDTGATIGANTAVEEGVLGFYGNNIKISSKYSKILL